MRFDRMTLPDNDFPLTGCRVLVSRAKKQAGALSSALRDLGCEVIEIPVHRDPSAALLPAAGCSASRSLATYEWLILTSVNGVDALFERMAKKRVAPSALAHLKIAAIGPTTKRAIEERGLDVQVTPKEYVAESVVRALRRRVKNKRVLLVRARVARDVIPRELRVAGASVDVVEAYETVVPRSSATRLRALLASERRRPHVITFTSSSTVRNFVQLLGLRSAHRALHKSSSHNGVHSASIGPVTSATLREFGLPVDIEAKEYTIPGLVAAIVNKSEDVRPNARAQVSVQKRNANLGHRV